MINEYRKKPVVVKALQYRARENEVEVLRFASRNGRECHYGGLSAEELEYRLRNGQILDIGQTLVIKTLEGDHIVSNGDFVIEGVQGEYYPCKPDIFDETYTKVQEK